MRGIPWDASRAEFEKFEERVEAAALEAHLSKGDPGYSEEEWVGSYEQRFGEWCDTHDYDPNDLTSVLEYEKEFPEREE